MNLFSWFGVNKKIGQFAAGLAEDLAKRYPPEMQAGGQRKISAKGISNILEGQYEKAISFGREHKLGMYRKAKLCNTFKWRLSELGYDKEFVEVATEGLLVYLTRETSLTPQPAPPSSGESGG